MSETKPLRILVTGSRSMTNYAAVRDAIRGPAWHGAREGRQVIIVHGDAPGCDQLAKKAADEMGYEHEPHPWKEDGHPDPKARNTYMVELGADYCLAFARSWYSGTGNCARTARKHGIRTADFGVSTRTEDRPARPVGEQREPRNG